MLEADKYYTVEQVARELHVSGETIRAKIRTGRLPARPRFIGRGYEIRGGDVLDRVGEIQAEETGNG